jgi:hypothetical protein
VTGCGAVFVVLGPTPEDDRLERCSRQVCEEHQQQLGWVAASLPRSVAYQRQVVRYEQTRQPAEHEQASLL